MGPRLALAAALGVACLALPACTSGTTPNCSDAQCGATVDVEVVDSPSDASPSDGPPTDGGADGG
jgi:hypothetical protein